MDLISCFKRFKPSRILLVGDFMLDIYTNGDIKRVSPEAPVPILRVEKRRYLPGGAGNVALSLAALGALPLCVGSVGCDLEGEKLRDLLETNGLSTDGLFVQKGGFTSVKNRFIARSQQLIRVDDETIIPIDVNLEERVLSLIKTHLDQIETIVISDYGKGFLSSRLLRVLIREGKDRKIPVIVDPKGEDFSRYLGVTMIKPNLEEARKAAQLKCEATLDQIGSKLLHLTQADQIIVTRSSQGITLFGRGEERFDFPVKVHEVNDVTGAGDTVLAVLAMVYAADLGLREGISLANIAASIAIERVGCACVSPSEIAERILNIQIGKIFDEDHLFLLEKVLRDKKLIIIFASNMKEGYALSLLSKIQTMTLGEKDERLIVCLSQEHRKSDSTSLIASLHKVDYVLLKSNGFSNLLGKIRPTRVYIFEEDELRMTDQAEILGEFISRF